MSTDTKADIKITLSDLKELVYFSLLKFNEDSLHRSGMSSKRDAYGAYLERWLNRIIETKIFDHIFSIYSKEYSVCSDTFIYKQGHEKNAPDILGLKKNSKVYPFGYFKDNSWVHLKEMPAIEVKAIRSDQYLLATKKDQISDYYCFAEVKFRDDYIASFFNKNFFQKDIYNSILSKMDSKNFLKGINDKIILEPEFIDYSELIGTIKLIGIFDHNTFIENSILCDPNTNPYFLKEIDGAPTRVIKRNILKYGNHNFINNKIVKKYENLKYIPVLIKDSSKIDIISDDFKSSLYLNLKDEENILGKNFSPGEIKFQYSIFERNSKWHENIGLKNDFLYKVKDSTENLLSDFDKIIS